MSARKRKQEEEEAELKRKNTDAAYQGKCFLLLLFSLNIILIRLELFILELIEDKMNAIHKSVQFILCVPGPLDNFTNTCPHCQKYQIPALMITVLD